MNGKKIWITGASSGIGRALAIEASRAGAVLLLSGRNIAALEETRSLCARTESVALLPFDLSETESIQTVVNQAQSLMGTLDLVVANAGIGQWGSALETLDEVEANLFKVNFEAVRLMLKSYARACAQTGQPGHFMAIGSIAAKFGQARLAAYSASKAALTRYLESFWRESRGSSFKLQLLHPGMVQTEIMKHSLGPDGLVLPQHKEHKGMSPNRFARAFFRFAASNAFEGYIGGSELLAVPFHALFPRLFYRILGK